ncbi:MAG: MBOAT family protein [Planctomycetes bacterium]|nr:MBOAT family protein [Planctomycetota bacterium]
MLFNSIEFFLFLPLVTLIYFSLPLQGRRVFLLFASFVFYGFFSVPLSLLLVFSTVLDYSISRYIQNSSHAKKRKAALLASLIGNLGVLAAFKYLDFFSYSLAALLGYHPWPVLNLVLPMGISFYTFQTMSYTIDVYRGDCKARESILDVALYVSFFPQLVAGPIMRGTSLISQFNEYHKPNLERMLSGALLCCWGLLKKVYIADPVGDLVNSAYGTASSPIDPGMFSGWALLLATYGFAVQIYCDFSAYSDIAIGSSRILGIRLMKNFDAPYLSCSIRDFWRRWHISLSTWLRDYLYIPLGGSRISKIRMYVNLTITMLLGGLWHGANWTFVIWGALHGLYLAFERHFQLEDARKSRWGFPGQFIRGVITFHLVCLAWIFFRANSVGQAFEIVSRIATWEPGRGLSIFPVLCLALLLATQLAKQHIHFGERLLHYPTASRWAVYATLALVGVVLLGSPSPEFIYFQF